MKNAPLVAVVQFPGSNCEYETAEAVRQSGMDSRIFRWNQWHELSDSSPDAFILPGGFSFQDRVRAGVVAAKEEVMDLVFEQASCGKPVLGICNGAQILVESGLVPGWEKGRIDSALAANHISGRSGYLSRWVFLKGTARALEYSPWLVSLGSAPVPIPIAHAEGRFVFPEGTGNSITDNVALVYCDENGNESPEYPVNPNGSFMNIAGIMNREGNVLAMMPHPERSYWIWQIPPWMPGSWGDRRADICGMPAFSSEKGPGYSFFRSLAKHFGLLED